MPTAKLVHQTTIVQYSRGAKTTGRKKGKRKGQKEEKGGRDKNVRKEHAKTERRGKNNVNGKRSGRRYRHGHD